MQKPNPKCVECIGKEQAEYYLTVPHDAITDEICYHCGQWDKESQD